MTIAQSGNMRVTLAVGAESLLSRDVADVEGERAKRSRKRQPRYLDTPRRNVLHFKLASLVALDKHRFADAAIPHKEKGRLDTFTH
jgi:hypothetical protein